MTASIRGGIFTMAMLLKGAEVAKALTEELHAKTEELKKNGVEPCLAILRVGAREDDLAYERGALKCCEKVGVAVRQVVLPEDVTQEVLMENIHALGADEKVHGVLMFRPLPGHLDDEAARAALDPKKDMDGITDGSMTAVYAGTKGGYPPCTAAACVALLKQYPHQRQARRRHRPQPCHRQAGLSAAARRACDRDHLPQPQREPARHLPRGRYPRRRRR